MKVCILMGSPRENGNTASLLKPFIEEIQKEGFGYNLFWLKDMDIDPCTSCRTCQADWNEFGCIKMDDMYKIYEAIMKSELIVFASPIYSWYCTPQMKVALDRLVFGMNKIYGEKVGPLLWKGRKAAIITSCGYPIDKGADLWEEGMKRYCKHSGLKYIGMMAERHMGFHTVFMDSEKEEHARAFARKLASDVK